jgi:hypothetical protein
VISQFARISNINRIPLVMTTACQVLVFGIGEGYSKERKTEREGIFGLCVEGWILL